MSTLNLRAYSDDWPRVGARLETLPAEHRGWSIKSNVAVTIANGVTSRSSHFSANLAAFWREIVRQNLSILDPLVHFDGNSPPHGPPIISTAIAPRCRA